MKNKIPSITFLKAFDTKPLILDDIGTDDKILMREIDLSSLTENEQETIIKEESKFLNINHPNIIGYNDCYLSENFLYLETKYFPTISLKDFLKENYPNLINENLILEIFIQICLAIKYIHENGLFLRGFSLDDIFLLSNGILKLNVYNKIRIIDHIKPISCHSFLDPNYISPETCLGKKNGKKSDIWCLGCVLYEICSFLKPFIEDKENSLVRLILNSPPKSISINYSIELRSLLDLLLNKSSNSRPNINIILTKPIILNKLQLLYGDSFIKSLLNYNKSSSQPILNRNILTAPTSKRSIEKTKKIIFEKRKKRFQNLSLNFRNISIKENKKIDNLEPLYSIKDEIKKRRLEIFEQIVKKKHPDLFEYDVQTETLINLHDISFDDDEKDEVDEINDLVLIAESIFKE